MTLRSSFPAIHRLSDCWIAASLFGIVFVGLETAAAETPTDLAETVRQAHQSVAAAEVEIAQVRVEVLTQQLQILQTLGQNGNSSWLEIMSADGELCEANARLAAAKKFQTWLQQQRIGEYGRDVTIHFNLPGSKAILGWVSVSEMTEQQQPEILALLNEQQQLPASRFTALTAAQLRIDTVQHAITTFRQSESDHSLEVQLLNLQRSQAIAEHSLIQAETRLRDAECQQMKSMLTSSAEAGRRRAVSHAASKNPEPALNHQIYEQSLHNLLSLEAERTGQILVFKALQNFAETDYAAAAKLRSLGFASIQRADLSRLQLKSLEQSTAFQRNFPAWQQKWISQRWGKRSLEVAATAHVRQASEPQDSNRLPHNPELLRTILGLYREQTHLKAEQNELIFRMEQHTQLLDKLMSQSQQNPSETRQAMLLKDLLAAQAQHNKEQLRLAALSFAAVSELLDAQVTRPTSLEFLDQDAANLILFAAERYETSFEETESLQAETELRRRVADVGTLLAEGYASRREMFNAQQRLFDFLAEREQRRINAQRSRIRDVITKLILKKHVAILSDNAVTRGSGFNHEPN